MLPGLPGRERPMVVCQGRGKLLAFRVVVAWRAQGRHRQDGCRNQRSLSVASVRNLLQFVAEHVAQPVVLVGR
jgi:hypothetical protein